MAAFDFNHQPQTPKARKWLLVCLALSLAWGCGFLLFGCAAYVTSDANGQPHVGMLSLVPIAVPPPPVYAVEAPIR